MKTLFVALSIIIILAALIILLMKVFMGIDVVRMLLDKFKK